MGLNVTTPFPYLPGGSTGDLLFCADVDGLISPLPDVSAGSYLRSGGVGALPLWSTLKLPNGSSTGDLLAATSLNNIGVIPGVSSGQVLASGGLGAPPAYTASPSLTNVLLAVSGAVRNASGTNFLKPDGLGGFVEFGGSGIQWTFPAVNVAVAALDWTYGAATIRFISGSSLVVARWSPQPSAAAPGAVDAAYTVTTTPTSSSLELVGAIRGDTVAGGGAGSVNFGLSGRVTDNRVAVAATSVGVDALVGGTNASGVYLAGRFRGGPVAYLAQADPGAPPAGYLSLYGALSGGSSIPGFRSGLGPAADIGIVSTDSGLIEWNGHIYKVPLVFVS